MTNQEKTKYLKMAAKIFSEPPELELDNIGGLCNYFKSLNLSEDQIKEILRDKYSSDDYMFTPSISQLRMYDFEYNDDIKMMRRDWCLDQIKELTSNKKN